jgi:periplasmic protein TonB
MPMSLMSNTHRAAIVTTAVVALHLGGLVALQSEWLTPDRKIASTIIPMQIVNQVVNQAGKPEKLPAVPKPPPTPPALKEAKLQEPARPARAADPLPAPSSAPTVAPSPQPQAAPIATTAVNAPTALPSSAPAAVSMPAAVSAPSGISAPAQSTAPSQEPKPSNANSAASVARSSSAIVEPIIESSYSTDSSRFKRSRISETLRESGTVSLTVTVASDGSVKKVVLKRSSGYPRLDAVALREAKLTAFKPATMNGSPIERDYQWDIVYDEIN